MAPLPPEPSEPPAAQTLKWMLRPIAFMESCRRRFGDAFRVRFIGAEQPMALISNPEAIRALYTEPGHGLPPARSAPLLPLLGPDSVLLLEGADHLARRKLIAPGFHGERMRSCERIVREVAEREVATWPRHTPFALHPRMRAITLEVVMRSVFGIADPLLNRQLGAMLVELLGRASTTAVALRIVLAHRLSQLQPLPASLRRLSAGIDRLLLAEIAARRAEPAERDDIASLLVRARFDDGSAIGDREVRDQLVTLLLAGYETTAAALAWSFDLVLRHPRVAQRVAGGEDDAYLRAVVWESLRLRPVLSFVGRRLSAELPLGEHSLPAGSNVAPAAWLTHTRADLYPQPFAFRPERFAAGPPPTYGWFPFGGGVRRCLGGAFAELEMRVVLETVLRRCQLRAVGPRSEPIRRSNLMLSPGRGTLVELVS